MTQETQAGALALVKRLRDELPEYSAADLAACELERLHAQVQELKRWQEDVRSNSPLLARLDKAEAQLATLKHEQLPAGQGLQQFLAAAEAEGVTHLPADFGKRMRERLAADHPQIVLALLELAKQSHHGHQNATAELRRVGEVLALVGGFEAMSLVCDLLHDHEVSGRPSGQRFTPMVISCWERIPAWADA